MILSYKPNKRFFSILIVIIFCISVYGIVTPLEDNQTTIITKNIPIILEPDDVIRQSVQMVSDPIVIYDNSEFADFGFPGSGTSADPYIIEGKEFSASDSSLISISGTTLYFLIENNTFDGQGSSHEAIYLDDVRNGVIRNNNFSNIDDGVYLHYSSYIDVIDNNFNNLVAGVSILRGSHNNLVDNNQFFDMSYYGIWVSSNPDLPIPSNNILKNNDINSDFRGIAHYYGYYDEILNNNIAGAIDGIYLDSLTIGSLISGNKIHDNQNGIVFSYSPSGPEGNTIRNNVISNNTKNGILVEAGIENLFEYNIILNNGKYGFFSNSSESRYNSIIRNDFVGNNLGSKQGYEGNISNNYSFNFWADHDNIDNLAPFGTADSPYNLDGEGLDQDPSPKTTPYNIIHRLIGAQLTYPDGGGEPLRGSVDITWTPGSDSFGYNIFYTLELVDSDSTTVIASGLTGSSYSWDTTGFSDGDSYKIRITTENTSGGSRIDISNDFFSIDNILGDPIYIGSNSDFAELGLPGDGSEDNPYIIENLVISGSTGVLLEIQNTDVYFIVRNNQFNGEYSSYDAIYLQNVVNGIFFDNDIIRGNIGVHIVQSSFITLDSNLITKNSAEGVVASYSSYLTIINNTISYNGDDGIFFENTESSLISGNDIFRNGNSYYTSSSELRLSISGMSASFGAGIFLDPSPFNVIKLNNIYENEFDGILLHGSDFTTITSNEILNNGFNGIAVIDSSHGVFNKNTISFNGGGRQSTVQSFSSEYIRLSTLGSTELQASFGAGIFLDPGDENTVEGNIISDNGITGIYMLEINNSDILDNTISGNGETGVYVNNSYDNSISGNTITNNGVTAGLASTTSLKASFGAGIFLDPSSGNTLTNNLISNNGETGVYVQNSNGNTISFNTITSNGKNVGSASITGLKASFGAGIFLDPSNNNAIIHNNVENNLFGIVIEDSTLNNVAENVLKNNFGYGLSINAVSSSNTATNNDFINNNGGGIQAYDDGTDNTFTNNFWSDLDDPTGPYLIDGAAGSTDPSPASVPNNLESPMLSDPVLLHPNGGERITGVTTVEWEKVETSSPDVEITYSLYLSSLLPSKNWDVDKLTWTPIVEGLVDQSSYKWDTTKINGKFLLKLVASAEERLFTREDLSDDTFKLNNVHDVTRPTKTTTTPSLTLIGILGAFSLIFLKRKKFLR